MRCWNRGWYCISDVMGCSTTQVMPLKLRYRSAKHILHTSIDKTAQMSLGSASPTSLAGKSARMRCDFMATP